MRLMKRFFALVLMVMMAVGCCLFTGCTSLYDVAPKTYGEWDGNYIYAGNMRCKTTGEEEGYLVETLTKEDEEYTVIETTDYEYAGDEIYMCMTLRNTANEEDMTTCFVCYDVKEKKCEVIYWETLGLKATLIYKISETFVVLCTAVFNNTQTLFKIDYDGNVLSENEDYLNDLMQAGEYLVGFDYGEQSIYYRTWEETEFTKMFTVSGKKVNSINAQYAAEGTRKGFLLQIMANSKWCGLYFYDLEKKEPYELLQLGITEEFVVKDGYVMVGTPTEVDYTVSSTLWGSEKDSLIFLPKTETTTLTFDMWQNCKLYRIDYATATLADVYDFSVKYPERDFSDFRVLDGGRIYFYTQQVIVKGGGCRGSDEIDDKFYLLNVETGALKKTSQSTYSDWVKTQKKQEMLKISCGEYAYYFRIDSYSWFGSTVCTLCRYHLETQATEAMQFWEEYMDQVPDGSYQIETDDGIVTYRYSPKLKDVWDRQRWYYGEANADMFFVRDY